MQLDIDKAIELLRELKGDAVDYCFEREIDGQKYKIKIRIEAQ